MVVRSGTLRWLGSSLVMVNLAMLIYWGWGTLFLLGLGFGCVLCVAGWWAEAIDLSNEVPLLVSLIGVLTIFGNYFYFVFTNPDDIRAGLLQFVGAVILLIALKVITYSLVAVESSSIDEDERDAAIQRAASRWAYGVLVAGIWVLVGQLVLAIVFDRDPFSHYLLANLLLLIIIVAELANVLVRLYFYRLGISRG